MADGAPAAAGLGARRSSSSSGAEGLPHEHPAQELHGPRGSPVTAELAAPAAAASIAGPLTAHLDPSRQLPVEPRRSDTGVHAGYAAAAAAGGRPHPPRGMRAAAGEPAPDGGPVSAVAAAEPPEAAAAAADAAAAAEEPPAGGAGSRGGRDAGCCRDEHLFASQVDEEHLCSIGHGVLVNPVMTPCQHEFCEKCINEALRHKSECPLCRRPITQDDVKVAIKTSRMVGKLIALCDNTADGCAWQGKWSELKAHRETCPFETVRCPYLGCTSRMARSALQPHIRGCGFRPVSCQHCGTEIPGCDASEHESECPKYPVVCPQKCSDPSITRDSLASHVADCCPFTQVLCPFQPLSCPAGQMQRINLPAHLERDTARHLLLLCAKVKEQDEVIARQQLTISRLLRRSLIVVDPSGKGTFTTITEAVENAENGDRVVVRPGLYRECLMLTKSITLQADGAPGEVQIENGGDANVVVLRASCRLIGFSLRQRSRNFFCIRVLAADEETVVERCDVQSDHFSCIQIDSGANPLVRHNRVHDSKQCGILVKRNGSGRIEYNDIFGNCLSNVYIDAHAQPTVRHNQIHNSQQHGIWIKQHGGGVIVNNTIYNNQMSNIKIEEGATPSIRKNMTSS
eukprot:TRINITY_DN14061_c0_g2_i1.p1 TRINITY_DN14061_c0_g2~~TRINITY_DN14061_c0_g2_i1.p1  ORF type:complete len:658 (+),score=216.29 TRINITY_DN14061_c0_g2_i1:93-1976(+)